MPQLQPAALEFFWNASAYDASQALQPTSALQIIHSFQYEDDEKSQFLAALAMATTPSITNHMHKSSWPVLVAVASSNQSPASHRLPPFGAAPIFREISSASSIDILAAGIIEARQERNIISKGNLIRQDRGVVSVHLS